MVAHTAELVHRLRSDGVHASLLGWQRAYPGWLHPAGPRRTGPPDVPPVTDARRTLRWDRPAAWRQHAREAAEGADLVVLVHVMAAQVPALLALAHGARRARSASGRPPHLVLLAHNVLPHERHPADRFLVGRLVQAVDAVLVHTDGQADTARRLGASRVLRADLPPHLPRTGAERAALDRPTRPVDPVAFGGLRVLFAGHVRGYKGLDVLLDAVARVPGVRLTVAGEAWGRARRDVVRRLAEDVRLAERVEVRNGYVPADELGRLLSAHDVLALPYLSASGSQNADLAFAHGLPVIASDLPAFARVRHGVDGLLVPPGDAPALSDALSALQAPGRLRALTSGVRAPRDEVMWDTYVGVLTQTSNARRSPRAEPTRSGQTL